jgi:hypothetical protein
VLAFADRDGFTGAEIVAQNFREQLPAATDLRREPLAHDVAQRIRKPDAELLLFAEGKESENTIDRLAGIDRVERAQHEMAGLSRHQGDFDGRAVAHFAHQNDLGRLAQGRAQAVGIIVKIVSQLALVERGAFRRVHEFDRIFERDDVNRLLFVDLVEERCQGGRLTTARRASD